MTKDKTRKVICTRLLNKQQSGFFFCLKQTLN